MNPLPIPQVTLEEFDTDYRDFHLVHAASDRLAVTRPGEAAIINATRGTVMTWEELRRGSVAVAAELRRLGFRKGDFLAASLGLSNEHILLEYACFRLGVIHAPLDMRLQPAEVLRSLAMIGARGYAFPGTLGALGESARQQCETLIEVAPPNECISGAISFGDLMARASSDDGIPPGEVTEHDGAQVIFTTGSTGPTKPALLSHRGITCQNLCLGKAFGFGPEQRVLCNLPASHVGGQAEILMTSLYSGGTAVMLEGFDAVKSLEAIERHGVTLIGQIPAMFQLEWRTADFGRRNFASLRTAVYGGQAVLRPFLERMLEMAPRIATGLGLTETSGFCTYTELTPDADAVARSIGWAMPAYPVTIRGPLETPGPAGPEAAAGEIGHICFRGPQTFLGYVNDRNATGQVLSTDGWLYTGDMGYVDGHGLHFSGRAKWVLKPAGYQVFPGEIEEHFSRLGRVAGVGVVGHEHRIWSEGVIAFVEKRAGAELSEAELRKHARSLASYMRPLHYVILEAGEMPLNRTAKVDTLRLAELAAEEVRKLRERGRWDRG